MRLPASLAGVVALVLVVVVAPEATGGGGTPITSCGQTVTTSAVLTQSLNCTGSGVIVGASGITIDLKGFTIRANFATGYGIDDTGGFDNVTVKNGVLRNFEEGILAWNGADKFSVLNVVASGNVFYGFDIRGDFIKIQSSTASGNGDTGVNAVGGSASIKSMAASGNYLGIRIIGNSGSIKSSTASGNHGYGITVSGNAASLKSNYTDGNGFAGGSDLGGLGINVTNYTTPPVGKNTARGNDDPSECQPATLC